MLMKAIICTKYGPPEVLHLREVEKPKPREDEVLIKIHATAVTSGDVVDWTGVVSAWAWLPTRLVFGFTKPRREIPGADLAGEIESVGKVCAAIPRGRRCVREHRIRIRRLC
jgi:NADPH:quinone reductase-like Zn-dependent oxidoreductase